MKFFDYPLISVVIPCYNSEKYIGRTLASLAEQTHQNLQIICVNDGSLDATKSLIEEHAKADSRIVLLNKENGGIESALKFSLPALKGEYTFLIGHDDTLSNDALAKTVQAFQENANLDAVRTDLHFVFEDTAKNYTMQDRRVLDGKEAFLETIAGWNIHTFCLWRTAIFQKINEVDAKGTFNFDELATRYLYLQCKAVGYCSGVYHYFQHNQSVSRFVGVHRFQALLTDSLLRQMIINANLYGTIASKFELAALGHLDSLVTLFFSMKNVTGSEKKYALGLMKISFAALNKDLLLALFPPAKRKVWSIALSSFQHFLTYVRARYFCQVVRRKMAV